MNYINNKSGVSDIVEEKGTPYLNSKEGKILEFLTEHKIITRKEAQELLGISQSTAGRILKTMVDNGQIAQIGGSRTTRYEPAKR